MKKLVFVILLFVVAMQVFPQPQEVSFTLDDRDRIMRTEEKLESFRNEINVKLESYRNEMNTKFETMDTKFEAVDSKIETLYWGFGIMIALMLFLFGYIVWDRRTALNPVQNKTMALAEKVNKIEFVYRQQAQKDSGFAEILRHAGLL